jgi:hypothetical protein
MIITFEGISGSGKSSRCKQGVIMGEERVMKRCPSMEAALLEKKIAELYSNNGARKIRIASYHEPVVVGEEVYLSYDMIKGENLLGVKNQNTIKSLVTDLAMFHEMFSLPGKDLNARVLYRDALASNYIAHDESYTHIDFSSSNKAVHAFDDLALLIHPQWIKVEEVQKDALIEEYISKRKEFKSRCGSYYDQISYGVDLKKNTDKMKRYYEENLINMGIEGEELMEFKRRAEKINFETLEKKDFDFFFDYRTKRAEFYLKKWDEKK